MPKKSLRCQGYGIVPNTLQAAQVTVVRDAAVQEPMKPHWDAQLYKKHSRRLQQESALALLQTLPFQAGDRVLDVGCGDGKITAALAQRAPNMQVVGTDLSQDMIALAQQDHNAHAHVQFHVANAEECFAAPPFDWAVSFFCLQWVPNKAAAFRALADSLKPGGRVALIMTDRNAHLLAARIHLLQQPGWASYFAGYEDATEVIDNDAYVAYAQDAGLQAVTYTEAPKTLVFDSAEELRAFIKMVTPALNRLPQDKRDAFTDALLERYLELFPAQESGRYTITYTLKNLQGLRP